MWNHHLSAWRSHLQLSQNELAERAGIPRPNLSAIERGRRDPTISTLEKIARALNLSVGQMLDQHPDSIENPGRHTVDEIAQAVASGDRSLTPSENQLADDIASQVINLLESHGAPGAACVKKLSRDDFHRPLKTRARYGAALVDRILKRLPKHLKQYGH